MPASTQQKTISLNYPLCPNQGFCTVDCPRKATCTVPRVPFLIPTIVIHYRTHRIYGDEYINDLALVKQEMADKALQKLGTHNGVPDLLRLYLSNIKLGAV